MTEIRQEMQATVPKTQQKLVEVSRAGVKRFLALECSDLIAPGGPIPLQSVTHQRMTDLSPEFLQDFAPTVIVLPLFAREHDALSMVEILEEFGFGGLIVVLAPNLPRPGLVEQELRAAGPGARLVLIQPG